MSPPATAGSTAPRGPSRPQPRSSSSRPRQRGLDLVQHRSRSPAGRRSRDRARRGRARRPRPGRTPAAAAPWRADSSSGAIARMPSRLSRSIASSRSKASKSSTVIWRAAPSRSRRGRGRPRSARRSGGSPACQSPVPALSITISSSRPASRTRWPHHALGRRRAADVAHADEQDRGPQASRDPTRETAFAAHVAPAASASAAIPCGQTLRKPAAKARRRRRRGVDDLVDRDRAADDGVPPVRPAGAVGAELGHQLRHVDLRAEHGGLVGVGEQQVDRGVRGPGTPGRCFSGAAEAGSTLIFMPASRARSIAVIAAAREPGRSSE